MQRAIAESEALARRQQDANYAPYSSSSRTGYAAPENVAGQFFTSADGKALPAIHSQASASSYDQHQNTYGHLGQASSSSEGHQSSNYPRQIQAPSRVKALYDFEPQEDGELAFRRGDIIRVVNSAYEGWWKGELDGTIGIFPLTYVVCRAFPLHQEVKR